MNPIRTMKTIPTNIIMNQILDHISAEKTLTQNSISTGISGLDNLTGGWKTGVNIIAARPGMGLTAFILTQLCQVLSSLKENEVVIYVADKDSSTALMHKLLSIATEVDLAKIQKGKLKKDDYDKLLNHPVTRQLKDKVLVFLNTNIPTVYALRKMVHSLKKEGKKPVMVFVDSLQAMVGSVKVRSNETESVLLDLNLLTEEYDLPMLCTMPLGRSVEYRESKYPRLSDLDPNLVNLASSILFLIRPEYYELIEQSEEDAGEAHLIIAKNEGSLDTVKLTLNRNCLSFKERVQESSQNLTLL